MFYSITVVREGYENYYGYVGSLVKLQQMSKNNNTVSNVIAPGPASCIVCCNTH